MAVTFVLRSHYLGPTDKHVVRFEDDTVLDWFVRHWAVLAGDDHAAFESARAVLGTQVYGFASLGRRIGELGLAPPDSVDALRELLEAHLYYEGALSVGPHTVQVLTDDDELQLAYYFFDDHFLQGPHGHRAAYLLHPDWRLPTGGGGGDEPFVPEVEGQRLDAGSGPGTTWACLVAYADSESIDGSQPFVIEGVRLPELPAWLARQQPAAGWAFRLELRLLRSQLLRSVPAAAEVEQRFWDQLDADPDALDTWSVFSDWLQQQARPPAHVEVLRHAMLACAPFSLMRHGGADWSGRMIGTRQQAHRDALALLDEQGGPDADSVRRAMVAVSPHLAQACFFVAEWSADSPQFHQWIFFDDVWAQAHPEMANALLRWTAGWDLLD
ncbi:MAG: hypothetical protein KTR31_41095 [Myxococcales bacterium]|nr:hypothetical protein [Myxococcales bacterium]